MSQRLPTRPHFELLRRHAKDVLRLGRLLNPAWRLADAQQALARGHGLASWGDLKRDVNSRKRANQSSRDAIPTEPINRPRQESVGTKPASIAGNWLSRGESNTDCVALEIVEGNRCLFLTQVIAGVDGHVIANTLTIRPDGREYRLDAGEDLSLQAMWSDPRTLQMVVCRGPLTVSEGTYVVSSDANTLTVTVLGRCHVFTRVSEGVQHTERRLRGRAPLLTNRTTATIMVMAIATCWGCAPGMQQKGTKPDHIQADLDKRAIETLNRHDIEAGLASDVDAIISQWTNDFVLLPSTGPIVRGKAANAAMVAQARQHLEKFEPVAYEVQFEEITVTGDYAFAWGHYRSVARVRETANDLTSTGKLLRIYQRQPDDSWLMHRTMVAVDPPSPPSRR